MSNFEALGPIYAKMGIATSAEIITARKAAAEAGYQEFKTAHLTSVVRAALDIAVDDGVKPLFDAMRKADPTLDLAPSDKEATALLGAIAAAEMKERSGLGGLTALGIVTAAFGGIRQSSTNPQLVHDADETLANMQFASTSKPPELPAPKVPDTVQAALDAMTVTNNGYGQILAPGPAMEAIRAVSDFALAAQKTVVSHAKSTNAYIRSLEEELRTYWWVVGGWSDELKAAFRTLKQSEAALVAGYELAMKTTLPMGLFAAPALLDRVMREDRKGRPVKQSLADAVAEVPAAFRSRFQSAVVLNGDLLPLSLALGLSAEGGSDEDWRPRFKRLTGLSADTKMGPHDLALQMYREVVIAKAMPRPK